ncbi:phosphoribosyltransferase domain-containing protein [Herbiconiux sp. P18]|uniref:phosphoribosyltransferase domain-containing protein n=1 Tax=Herbiconiux liangxiaofengii TaxID=3342795 RepID=UPI0035B78240
MTPWTGGFVSEAAGIVVRSDPAGSLVPVRSLVGLALRINPRRAQLLVSTVLAKHVPTVPAVAVVAGELLGLLVAASLDDAPVDTTLHARFAGILESPDASGLAGLREAVGRRRSEHPAVVTIGYAETATGLGQLVAGVIGSPYLHSTRHVAASGAPSFGFEEEHSHASSHRLHPTRGAWLRDRGTVVLVDDEISTGTTVINTIRTLQGVRPQAAWVVAALVDLRSDTDRARFDALADELGTRITVVALGRGSVELPPDPVGRAAELIAGFAEPADAGTDADADADADAAADADADADAAADADVDGAAAELGDTMIVEPEVALPIRSARHGLVVPSPEPDLVAGIAASIRSHLGRPAERGSSAGTDVLVLGSEEFIALPLLVAEELDRVAGSVRVLFSTTTRSPIAPLDRADYAIASRIRFRSSDLTVDGPGDRFAYNLTRGGRRFDTIVLMPEPGSDIDRLLAPDGVVEALRRVTGHVVVALLPAGLPTPDEWILQP